MTKYAPGTPASVIKAKDEKFYGNQTPRGTVPPPPKVTVPPPPQVTPPPSKITVPPKVTVPPSKITVPPPRPVPPSKITVPPPRPVAPVAPKGVAPKAPTPIQGISKDDPFYKSPEYKSFQNDPANRMGTMDMYDSPYFGSVGSGSLGRAQDEAYRKYKGIAEPTRPTLGSSPYGSSPAQPVGRTTGTPGGMGALLNAGRTGGMGMKKGGKVKDGSSNSGGNVSKSSNASKRGDGIAQRGKTKGRML
jgi:outer membrane biosynthesis protein TonB